MNELTEGLEALAKTTETLEYNLPEKTIALLKEVFGDESFIIAYVDSNPVVIPEEIFNDKDLLPFFLIIKYAGTAVPVLGKIWTTRLNQYLNLINSDLTLARNKGLTTMLLEDIIRIGSN